jgi:hypothetical protein
VGWIDNHFYFLSRVSTGKPVRNVIDFRILIEGIQRCIYKFVVKFIGLNISKAGIHRMRLVTAIKDWEGYHPKYNSNSRF